MSIVALAHHASRQDQSQQHAAELQMLRLMDKARSIRIISDLPGMERLRSVVADVGSDIESCSSTLLNNIEPEPFAMPWE